MYTDRFEARIAKVRHRFATALESKITDALVFADRMARGEDGDFKLVSDSYRHLHSICGIGPTVGFVATGEAARAAESTILQAMYEGRQPKGTHQPEEGARAVASDRRIGTTTDVSAMGIGGASVSL